MVCVELYSWVGLWIRCGHRRDLPSAFPWWGAALHICAPRWVLWRQPTPLWARKSQKEKKETLDLREVEAFGQIIDDGVLHAANIHRRPFLQLSHGILQTRCETAVPVLPRKKKEWKESALDWFDGCTKQNVPILTLLEPIRRWDFLIGESAKSTGQQTRPMSSRTERISPAKTNKKRSANANTYAVRVR